MTRANTKRWAWAVTGSGHYLTESLDLIRELVDVDVFLSRAADEVLRMYKTKLDLPPGARMYRDNTASAAPVAMFYHGEFHTLIVAPATSNTVAKCVLGISDTLPTNVFAQAGKCRVPAIVFACDSAPEMETPAPEGIVKVFPRAIDLEHTARLGTFERTDVVLTLAELRKAIARRRAELAADA